jgi:hypothetical protein
MYLKKLYQFIALNNRIIVNIDFKRMWIEATGINLKHCAATCLQTIGELLG